MATFAIALAAALLFGAGIGVLGMCGYLATSRIERAVVERRAAEAMGASPPGLWGRLWAAVLRRVVRWLRRHRYAAVAERTRALEVELGIVTIEPAVSGIYAAIVTAAIEATRTQPYATDHNRNYFVNGAPVLADYNILTGLHSALATLRPQLPPGGSQAPDMWRRDGFNRAEALSWYQAGFTPWHAKDYRERYGNLHGVPTAELIRWAEETLDASERYARLTARPCRECTAAPAHKQLHPKLQAATQLMAAGFQRRDAMEVAGLLDEPMMASDPSARDGFAWPKPDPRLTTRNSE